MIAMNLKKNSLSDRGWIYYKDEIKYTSNSKLLADELKRIFKKRIWLEIRSPGYKSSPMLLMSVRDDEIEIERPSNWSAQENTFLLEYHTPGEPWHSIKVHVKRVTGDSIFLHLPELCSVTERRDHFRVGVPADSAARIIIRKKNAANTTRRRAREKFWTGRVKDISAGGICIFPEKMPGLTLPELRMIVGPLELNLKINADKVWPCMVIQEAEVVRIAETMLNDKRTLEIALKFRMNHQEEKNMLNYIRQRELAIIKSGVE